MTLLRLERMLRIFAIVLVPVGVTFMVAATLWLRQHGSPIPNLATGEVQPFRFCGQNGSNCTATVYITSWELGLIWLPGMMAGCAGLTLLALTLIRRLKPKL